MESEPWIPTIQSFIKRVADSAETGHILKTLSHLLVSQHRMPGPFEELLYRLLPLLSNLEFVTSNSKYLSAIFLDGPADVSFEVWKLFVLVNYIYCSRFTALVTPYKI